MEVNVIARALLFLPEAILLNDTETASPLGIASLPKYESGGSQ